MERGSVIGDYYEANRMKAFEEAASCSSSIRWLKFNFIGGVMVGSNTKLGARG